MTIQRGVGYASFVDHAFTGDIAAVIAEQTSGFFNRVTGGQLRITGAAAMLSPTIVKNTGSSDTFSPTAVCTFDLDDGETCDLPAFDLVAAEDTNPYADVLAGGSLTIAGGAALCVLNGTIYFTVLPLGAA